MSTRSDPALTFTGTWVAIQGNGPSGNGAYYTYAPNATVSFKVGNVPFSIFQTLAAGSGSFSVSIDGGTAAGFSNNSVNTLWQQAIEFPAQGVGTHNVVITKTSSATDFIYIDGIRVVDPIAPLTVGQYQETYPGLTFTGTWPSNGTSKVTSTSGNTLTFKFTGNGFGFITTNPNINGTMTVSCKIGAGSDVCADPTSTPINGGYSFYNLKQGTYDVVITYTSSGGLYIDRVFVLDTPATILQPGSYEETAPGIVYSPNDLWTTYSSASYSGGTVKGTQQKRRGGTDALQR